jgi:hypothetical protein
MLLIRVPRGMLLTRAPRGMLRSESYMRGTEVSDGPSLALGLPPSHDYQPALPAHHVRLYMLTNGYAFICSQIDTVVSAHVNQNLAAAILCNQVRHCEQFVAHLFNLTPIKVKLTPTHPG